MRGRPGCLLQSAGGEANRILLASALSSMHIVCPNRVSWCDWIITREFGLLCQPSYIIVLYILVPFDASSIRRHYWSSALIFHASVLDIAQQSEPYMNIGKMHVLYSFNFVEMARSDFLSSA